MDSALKSFLVLWIVLPLIVFCLAKSRLPLYIVPLSIPLSLFLVFALRQVAGLTVRQVVVTSFAVLCVATAARYGLGAWPMKQNMRQLYSALEQERPAHIAAVVDEKAYGLQFYAQGKVSWILESPDAENELKQYMQKTDERRAVIVRTKKAAMVESMAASLSLIPSTRDTDEWAIFLFGEPEQTETPARQQVPSS